MAKNKTTTTVASEEDRIAGRGAVPETKPAAEKRAVFQPVRFDALTVKLVQDEILREVAKRFEKVTCKVTADEARITGSGYASLGLSVTLDFDEAALQKAVETAVHSTKLKIAIEDFGFTEPRMDVDLVYLDVDGKAVPRARTIFLEKVSEFEDVDAAWLDKTFHLRDENDELDPNYPFAYQVVGLRTTSKKTPLVVRNIDPLGDPDEVVFYSAKDLKQYLEAPEHNDRARAEKVWESAQLAPRVKLIREARAKAAKIGGEAAWEEVFNQWEKCLTAGKPQHATAKGEEKTSAAA
jgi:hypothetical protein